ncbi:hypothetical protein FHT29_005265 [Rhizobium sp. SG741]|jgi:hypothetical protein|nr:hypothetical protein [Rhizobium sp. SG741]
MGARCDAGDPVSEKFDPRLTPTETVPEILWDAPILISKA